jgi:hypothetical protein
VQSICDGYKRSPQNARYMAEVLRLHSSQHDEYKEPCLLRLWNMCFQNEELVEYGVETDPQEKKSRYKTSGFTQLRWLIWRNFVDVFKNPFEIRLRIFLAIVSSMLD